MATLANLAVQRWIPSRQSRRNKRTGSRSRRPLRQTLLRLERLEERQLLATIQGCLFEDISGNGIFDADDSQLAMPGVTIYLDQNQNGVLDTGELSTETDSTGAYQFGGLPARDYTIAQVVPEGWMQTSPAPISGPGLLGDVQADFDTPAANPIGLAWAESSLPDMSMSIYCLARYEKRVYELSPVDGGVISSFSVPAEMDFFDISHDGQDFWGVNPGSDLVVRFDHQGALLQSFPAPGTYGRGITWHAGSLWIADSDTAMIYEVQPSDGAVLSSFPAPGDGLSTLQSLASDGQHLWMNRWSDPQPELNRTYEIDPANGTVLRSFLTPSGGDIRRAAGLAIDGNALWIAQYYDGKLFRTDIASPGTHIVTVNTDSDIISDRDFGSFGLGSVSGTVVAGSDQGLEGWRVFVDGNGNAQYDPWEETAITEDTGNYLIGDLRPGDHSVMTVLREPGWSVSTFSAATVSVSGSGDTLTADFAYQQTGIAPVGPETLVNAYVGGSQDLSDWWKSKWHSIATDDQGRSVVVWQGEGVGDATGIFARQFDASGNPIGETILVNTVTDGTQTSPLVAKAATAGSFAVVWQSALGLRGRMFQADGSPMGPEFSIATGTAAATSIGMDSQGNFVVGSNASVTRSGDTDVYFQMHLFASTGALTRRITIDAPGSIVVASGRVDMNRGGEFAAIYTYPELFVQHYDRTGKALGSRVCVAPGVAEWAHDIALDDAGGFVATWYDGGQYYNPDGTPRGAQFTLESSEVRSIDIEPDGDVITAWSRTTNTTNDTIYAQRLAADGTLVDTVPFVVNTTQAGIQSKASVAVDPSGNFVVAWSGAGIGDDQGVFIQRYAGPPPTPPEPNNPPTGDAGGPYAAMEDAAVSFDASASIDPDADPLTYLWDFGDGSSSTGVAPEHTYLWGGEFAVTLTVDDGKGGSDVATTTASIVEVNDVPVAVPGGPYSGLPGQSITFDGSASYDYDNLDGTAVNDQTLTYTWDFGDGATGEGADVSHIYADVGDYTATLTVDDGNGGAAQATVTVTVAPVSAAAVHVADMEGTSKAVNKKKWAATVTILVQDGNGSPVSNATIQGSWSHGLLSTAGTDASGWTTIYSGNLDKSVGSVTFTINDIVHATLDYDSTLNTDADGDSDGTSIVVFQDGSTSAPQQLLADSRATRTLSDASNDDLLSILAADQTAREQGKSRPGKKNADLTDLALLELQLVE